jgi:hypothetical protein
MSLLEFQLDLTVAKESFKIQMKTFTIKIAIMNIKKEKIIFDIYIFQEVIVKRARS